LVPTSFTSEEEFERFIFDTAELLEDVFLLKRQVRHGRKAGVPDIIGVDNDGRVCILEMKNTGVDASILPQVLSYAFWAEQNPDAIKALWLEAPKQPEDIQPDWDNIQVRIIVIAPWIDRSTLNLVSKTTYQVDLIEIKRWIQGPNQFLLVSKLEPDRAVGVKPVRGLEVIDRDFYLQHYNKQSVDAFLSYARQVEKLIKRNGWELEIKFNKAYCGFKHGFFNAFGIKWLGTKTFAFFFKLPKGAADRASPRDQSMDKYEELWKEAVYKIEPSKTRVDAFLPLFKKSLDWMKEKAV
jgi:hypothetical protein